MQTHRLVAHPDHPPLSVKAVSVYWVPLKDRRTMLRFRVDGASRLVLPDYAGAGRGDNLWQTTCFELFLGNDTPAYFEFNFSPSGRWAAYGFNAYREKACDVELANSPEIKIGQGPEIFVLTAFLDDRALDGGTKAGISAVIEETGGRKSWWALSHPEGKPDFHDAHCHVLRIGPPDAT